MNARCFLVFQLWALACAGATGAAGAVAARIARNEPLTPEQSLAALKTEPGLRVELAAAEPLTGDPVALAWDERGRMFVAENRGYPEGPGEGHPPLGVIAMLEDTNGDGVYDKRTEFATGLTFPNGLMCWRGGLFVTCAPDIFYLKDTDGDGRADVKRAVLTGFDMGKTTQIRVSHPTLGLDGWVYLTSGLTGGKVTCPVHPERKPVEFTKSDSRFHPDTFEFETVAGQGQFGLCFDDLGRKFIVDNRHPIMHVVLEPRYLKRNSFLAFSGTVQDVAPSGELGKVFPLARDQTTSSFHPNLLHSPHAGTFTSSCGICIYGGDALPEFYGNAFICEPAQSLVQRQVIRPHGASFQSQIGRPGTEFLASPDNWFRPVFAANAPDGALYIASMYRKFIDHPQYVPEEMRNKLDFLSGRGMGRIYRVVAANREGRHVADPKIRDGGTLSLPAKKFDLGKSSVRQLVTELENPRVWRRETARRLLLERADKSSLAPLKSLAAKTAAASVARVAALRTLNALGVADNKLVAAALKDKQPGLREHGLLLAEPRLKQSPELTSLVMGLADDPDPRIRFLTALALGEIDNLKTVPVLARIATRDAADRWTRAAALSSVGKRSDEFLNAVLESAERNAGGLARADKAVRAPQDAAGIAALLAETARVAAASQPLAQLAGSLNQILGLASGTASPDLFATVNGFADALRSRKLTLASLVTSNAEARERLGRLFDGALGTAQDSRQPLPARQSAIGLLAHSDFAKAGQPLQALLAPQQPGEVRVAAARALGQFNDPAASLLLLDPQRWRSYTPPVRETVIAALMSQPKGVLHLLAAIETEAIPPWSIDATRRSQLLKSKDKAVREKAETVFKNAGGGDRMKVYEEYKSILALKGDATNGHAFFTKTCAQCHVMDGEGAQVGPELTGLRNQPAEVLLLHVLVPSYEILAGFNAYEIETRDGRTAAGLLTSETPTSVTLRRALGEEETILRANIASLTAGNLSLMPDELEKMMSKQDLRDLIAFLKGE